MAEPEGRSPADSYDAAESKEVDTEPKKAAFLRAPEHVADIGKDVLAFHHVFGVDLTRRGNLSLMTQDVIVYTTACSVVFENIVKKEKCFLTPIDDGGVGAVAVHPSKTLFAVGGKGYQPNIYIYSYPDMVIKNVLKGGAERGYANLTFNATGTMLASLATAPDYMLTVWNWREERISLHSKAFGQDVFSVRFSVDDERRLTSCGTGHIRFWKMAATFTGLKLQGHIGKFGKVELSDIAAFVELPDGKVVSGTESGALLLWEGNFIKCRFTQVGGKPCHDGDVTYVELDREERCLITAGLDGFIRWWDFDAIDTAEVDSDNSMDFDLLPIAEYTLYPQNIAAKRAADAAAAASVVEKVKESSDESSSEEKLDEDGNPVPVEGETAVEETVAPTTVDKPPVIGIKTVVDGGLIDCDRAFVIIDTNGCLTRVTFPLASPIELHKEDNNYGVHHPPGSTLKLSTAVAYMTRIPNLILPGIQRIGEGHAGEITGMDTCPIAHLAVTGGLDHTLRCWDYLERTCLCSKEFSQAVTSVRWAPLRVDSSGRSVLVGFADGTVRLIEIITNASKVKSFVTKMIFKPHTAPVIELAFDNKGEKLATSARDGTVFFFSTTKIDIITKTWTPLRFLTISEGGLKAPVHCENISWSADDIHVLCSCSNGTLRDIDLGTLAMAYDGEADMITSYEATFPTQETKAICPVPKDILQKAAEAEERKKADAKKAKEDAEKAKEEGGASASKDKKDDDIEEVVIPLNPLKIKVGAYSIFEDKHVIVGGLYDGKNYLVDCVPATEDEPATELPSGNYTMEGKDAMKFPATNSLRYASSKTYLTAGMADGSVIVRPAEYLDTFVRCCSHNGAAGGVCTATTSHDDKFLLSAGRDGTLAVYRVRLSLIKKRAKEIHLDIEAGVFESFEKPLKPLPKSGDETVTEPLYMTLVYTDEEKNDYAPKSENPPEFLSSLNKVVEIIQEFAELAENAYSIQDAKLKSEEDAQFVAADVLKERMRESIRLLQKDFERIRAYNETLPEAVRLSNDEIAVDGEYLQVLQGEADAMVSEIHKECAYEAEKAAMLRKKVTERLMDGLIIGEMPLHAFNRENKLQRQSVVCSLRTQGIDPVVQDMLRTVQKAIREEELVEAQERAAETAQHRAHKVISDLAARDEAANIDENGKRNLTEAELLQRSMHQGTSTSAARREARKARKQALGAHLTIKPSEDEDDERDIKAISLAEKTVGDYKLKSASDYEVPPEQRVNAAKKCRQMALLEQSIVTMRLQFNETFLAMRELKRQIVYAVRRDNARIREIDVELRQSQLSADLWEPSLNPSEFPDDRDEVTDGELQEYIKKREAGESWEKCMPPPHSVITAKKSKVNKLPGGVFDTTPPNLVNDVSKDVPLNPNETFISDVPEETIMSKKAEDLKNYETRDLILNAFRSSHDSEANDRVEKLENTVPILMFAREAKKKKMFFKKRSMQEVERAERRKRLENERKSLLDKIESDVKEFDDAIDDLRVERHKTVSDIKQTELKLLVMYHEYQLLKTFEGKDVALQQKQQRCANEGSELATNLADIKTKLDLKSDELRQWNDKATQVTGELKNIVPDSSPFAIIFGKIFRKKIRMKKGDDDDDDLDEEEDEDDEDEEDEVDDACPLGCDPAIYDRVLELRERRVATEEVCAEIKKAVDNLTRNLDSLQKNKKRNAKEAQNAEVEMQQFQQQKQAALNKIDIVVPLKISQLFAFETSGSLTAPSDQVQPMTAALDNDSLAEAIDTLKDYNSRRLVTELSLKSHVLFNRKNLNNLDVRIQSLQREIEEAKVSFQELHRERTRLNKDREGKRDEIEGWENRCRDLQMLKFGRVVDLDELEADADRSKEEEAAGALKQIEDSFRTKSLNLAKEIEKLQEKLAETTLKNTALLNSVADLTESKVMVTRELNAQESSMGGMETRSDETQDKDERDRIASYVQLQAREIEALKVELFMLKRKDSASLTMPHLPSPPKSSHLLSSTAPMTGTRSKEVTKFPPINGGSR